MQVALHLGAHMTDEDRLITCLIRNREMLGSSGTGVPAPNSYRKLIRGMLRKAAVAPLGDDARDAVIGAVAPDGEPERLILSGPSFLGTPKMAAGGGALYSAMEARLGFFHQIFHRDQIELFLSLKNLATFLPGAYAGTSFTSMAEFLRGTDPVEMRWYDLIVRLRSAFPDLPITLWCNEDTPLIWAEVLRDMAGLDTTVALEGEFALLEEILTPDGRQRFNAYIEAHPGMPEVQKRRVVAAFLDKFADEAALEEELDVPGWTEELVDRLSTLYDQDVEAIEAIPGIRFIAP